MVEMRELIKIENLTPQHDKVNVLAKIIKKGEAREVPSRNGPPRLVSDSIIGDETATMVLSLWQEQVNVVKEGDVIYIDNGYVSLFRGHMRLNIGKYGALGRSGLPMEVAIDGPDMSEKEYGPEMREGLDRRDRSGGRDDRGRDQRGDDDRQGPVQ